MFPVIAIGGQIGADMQRVEAAEARHELVHCELNQGGKCHRVLCTNDHWLLLNILTHAHCMCVCSPDHCHICHS